MSEMKLNNYYITFGSDEGFPYPNAYLKVKAPSLLDAQNMFRLFFPDRHKGVLNYSFLYEESEWKKIQLQFPMACAGTIELLLNGDVLASTIDLNEVKHYINRKAHETSSMMTISTAHIPPELADIMKNGEVGIPCYEKADYGFFLPITDYIPNHPVLKELFAYARDNDCQWLCLDTDGPVIEALPAYDWENDLRNNQEKELELD